MEELFKNETIYNKKDYKIFINQHMKKFGFKEDLYTILFTVFFIVLLLYLIINKVFITTVLMLFVFIIFLRYRFIQPIQNVKKDMESKKIKQEYKNIYTFYNHYFKIKNKEIDVKMFYFKIYRVLESDKHFYIYISPRQVFLISKSGFTKGNSTDFSKFIKKKKILKYKNICNIKKS